MSIREAKTYVVSCDYCDASTTVQVACQEPDERDAAHEANKLGWKWRSNYDYVFDSDTYTENRVDYYENLCPGDHPGEENRIGTGWK